MLFTSDEDAQSTCRDLQVLMGLQNWTIQLEMVEDLPEGTNARVRYVSRYHSATILLLRTAKNQVRTLVHELMHVSWHWLDALVSADNKLFDLLLEQTITAQAEMFYNLFAAARAAVPAVPFQTEVPLVPVP